MAGDSVTFRDRSYGIGDIVTALLTFNAMQDESAATDFLIALTDDAMKRKAGEALGEMIARGTPDNASFAGAIVGYLPGTTPMADLLAALQRSDLPDPRARIPFAAEIERLVFGGLAPYDQLLRTHAGRHAEYGWALTALLLVEDRAWALDNLETVLGPEANEASLGLRGALAQLDAAGKAELAAEMRARYPRLSKETQRWFDDDFKDANL
jgi:hypothetical protein